jgi:hypothetical protein
VLLASLAVSLLTPLISKAAWTRTDYASCGLLIMSFACAFVNIMAGGILSVMAAGRTPRTFLVGLMICEPLVSTSLNSFFSALMLLFAGVLTISFDASWNNVAGGGSPAYARVLPLLILTLACTYFLPVYLAGLIMLKNQSHYESFGRIVHKSALLRLEDFLRWNFLSVTNPDDHTTLSAAPGDQWRPLRAYIETHKCTSPSKHKQHGVSWLWKMKKALLEFFGPLSLFNYSIELFKQVVMFFTKKPSRSRGLSL